MHSSGDRPWLLGLQILGQGREGSHPVPRAHWSWSHAVWGPFPPHVQDRRICAVIAFGACSGRLAGGLFCGEVAGYLYCIPRRFFGSGGRVMDKILVATDGLSTCSPMHSRSCPCPSPPPSLVLVYFFPLNEGSCQLSLGMARDEGRITVVLRGSASPTNLFSACSFD